jgi:FkbM family methyltransferase
MPDFELLLERFFLSILHPGDTAVDVGAHTGRHTMPMLRAVAPNGRVFAVEPLPVAREELRRRLRTEPGSRTHVTIYPFALSDHEATEEFVFAVDLPGYSGLKERIYDYPTRIERIPVEVKTLDGLLADAPALQYLKIDAEGGELGVLRGASRLIARLSPVITFEFGANSLDNYGISVEDMAAFWKERPYRIFDILGRPLEPDAFVESAKRQEVWDYIALPSDRTAAVFERWRAVS